jgi:hypothetical protein
MTAGPDPHRDVRWAWGCVVLIVAGGILAQFVGYGIALLLGYDVPEGADPPLGAALLISLPALAIAVVPGIAALRFGVRGGIGGRFSGYIAAGIGALSIVYWVVLTMIGIIARA